ncbi:hypothetical protein [Streptomyces xiamenensis]|uniref:hypothetical protein n=1 Tax=Streptomyces xiamenensis TaxID=408015 RepID=UPI0035E101C4
MVVRHHIAETRRAPGRTEWITSTLHGPDGAVINQRGKQFSGRNIPKGRTVLMQVIADLAQRAQHIEENDTARAEDVARLMASKGIDPAFIGDRPATADDAPTHDGYVLTRGTTAHPAALVLHVTGHGPFSELAAIVGVLTDAGYTTDPGEDDFAVTVRGATAQELTQREQDAARRVAPLAAAILPT